MSLSNQGCSLEIKLLPEFGWSIKDEPVYGPGSVFQGFVKLNLTSDDIPIERIRLAFYAIEAISPFDISPGVMRTAREVLFSIQHTLWESKSSSQKPLDTNFPFTIQMPMVQFPPSINHTLYQCNFQLIAIMDGPTKGSPLFQTHVPVVCMPFVETSLLKTPLVLSSSQQNLSIRVKLAAQDFVPGDMLALSLHVDTTTSKKSAMNYVTVHTKLIQTLSVLAFDDIPDQIKPMATSTQKLLLLPAQEGSYCDADLQLKVPNDITPSYDYGKLVKISYTLSVSVEQKGPMCGIWNYRAGLEDIKITIGTLGYGIRTSNELKLYTCADKAIPKFMKAIEYEDALPLYDAIKLPEYSSSQVVIY